MDDILTTGHTAWAAAGALLAAGARVVSAARRKPLWLAFWTVGSTVLVLACGSVVTLDGKPMKYNQKEDILNPHFMVIGATDHDWLALLPDRE